MRLPTYAEQGWRKGSRTFARLNEVAHRAARIAVALCAIALASLVAACSAPSHNGEGPGSGGTDAGSDVGSAAGDDGATSNPESDSAAFDAAPVLGTLSAQLLVEPGYSIASLQWTVHNPTLLPADRTGTVDVSNSQDAQFVVGGLPVGDGYLVTITASADPGALPCMGSATFSIQANATTSVSVSAACGSTFDAGSNGSVVVDGQVVVALCPSVTALSASPSAVNVGGAIALMAAAGTDSGGSSSDVTLAWSTTGGTGTGTFSAPTGTTTTFTCSTPGPVTVTVTAQPSADASTTDASGDAGACSSHASVQLMCDGKRVTSLAVSPHDHVCARVSDGTVECWGANEMGQLGNGRTDASLVPVHVQNLSTATAVVTGESYSCALLAGGTVQCWGDQSKLGSGDPAGMGMCGPPCSMSPVPVVGLSGVTAIAAGSTHTCALLSGGTMACWGDNSSGQLGDGTTNSRLAPVAVAGISGVTAISTGDSDTCALFGDGSVKCWGYNFSGQLGSGTTGPNSCSGYPCSLKPVSVVGLTSAKAIVSGGSHTCAVLSDTTVQCWGFNDVGELGNGTTTNSPRPVAVSGLSGVTSLASGVYHICATRADGSVDCWGDNTHGDFCNGTMTTSSSPVAVPNLAGATVLSLGEYDTCALLPGGTVACCGNNTQGQLGDGTVNPSSTPVPVSL